MQYRMSEQNHPSYASMNRIDTTKRQDPCTIITTMPYSAPVRVVTVRSFSDASGSASGNQRQFYGNKRWIRAPQKNDRTHMDDWRHWIHNETLPSSTSEKFTLVSYNILGVNNATRHARELYCHIPSYIMDWNFRKGRILFELGLWSADIICLQEVDHFEDLQDGLVQQGYEGIYKSRTGGSPDGCAMFWRAKKFDLLEEDSIEYQELDLRHNVAQLCVLQEKTAMVNVLDQFSRKNVVECFATKRVVVCNIHVLFNPNRGDIKLGQVRHLLERAYSLSQKWGGIPVIVAGDFNSVPKSPLYQFLLNASLDISCLDKRLISGQMEVPSGTYVERWASTMQLQINNEFQGTRVEASVMSSEYRSSSYKWTAEELEMATGNLSETVVKHNFKLQSAYSSVKSPFDTRDSCNEPLVTTYHEKFMGTVDYIWFSEGLVSTKVLDVLPVQVLRRTKGLPSKKWGSDHLALASEFAFICADGL